MALSSDGIFQLGTVTTTTTEYQDPGSQNSDPAAMYAGMAIAVVLVGGIIALGFYQASKGIRPVYMGHDDHHHGGITFEL